MSTPSAIPKAHYLMWYDDSKVTPRKRIEDAIKDYTDRFGRAPNTALVNPLDCPADTDIPPGIAVRCPREIGGTRCGWG